MNSQQKNLPLRCITMRLLLLVLLGFEASVISALLLLMLPGQLMPSRAAYSAMVSVGSVIAEGWV